MRVGMQTFTKIIDIPNPIPSGSGAPTMLTLL